MAKQKRETGPKARLPKGFQDIGAGDIRATSQMLATIREVFERYGFEPLETPAIEYTDALGKFLPDQDRPNAGVFSFQDEDEQWMSLRYDLTAPLARFVAENFDKLPKPYRRYQVGPVWRNEKPGPGRFRQFMQFDADTVGTDNVAADAEICMLAADTLGALGLSGKYVIKVNNRKLLDGLLASLGIDSTSVIGLKVLRALDKRDRLGWEKGVELLLGKGRKDESGDFTAGAGLSDAQIEQLRNLFHNRIERFRALSERAPPTTDEEIKDFGGVPVYRDPMQDLDNWAEALQSSKTGLEGVAELREMQKLWWAAGYGTQRIEISASVVRGLEYYTGPVFEAEITTEVKNDDGQTVRFGSVGGGGRYDGLVERFLGQKVPAVGFSIGVSRLQAALAALDKGKASVSDGPVVVLVMPDEKGQPPDYARFQKLTQRLRQPDDGGPPIRAEMYLGTAGMKAQMKYADRRGAPCVVIQGGDERAKGEVQIKDLVEGAKASATITDSKEWREGRPAQISVKEDELLAKVREILARHQG